MITENINEQIKPFFWVQHATSVSVCLNAGVYKNDLFETRADEGFEGSGYDWASLATVFLNEQMPALKKDVRFDPESSMFCAYSSNENALRDFIIRFKEACENDKLIKILFSKAKLD
ncbi:Imm51 family immunity protein [Chitinophaga sp. 212800010-3]|uniref:Imm51 family immunity protein n=1 Tax=unclassified Chitinophaga TaxID=2619133 RepID=UPI002DEB8E96|nr:Immunity protein 51 [Chitinophaga sp. 212800010-3]